MYYQISNTTEQDLYDSMEEEVECVRTNLVLEEIAAQENIEIAEKSVIVKSIT